MSIQGKGTYELTTRVDYERPENYQEGRSAWDCTEPVLTLSKSRLWGTLMSNSVTADWPVLLHFVRVLIGPL